VLLPSCGWLAQPSKNQRHPREGGDPALVVRIALKTPRAQERNWIPAFAGMTSTGAMPGT